jgi:hypothetical protein
MKRSPLPFLVVLAACASGPDPSTTGGDIASVLVSTVASGAFVGSAVVDSQGQVYVTANDLLEVVRFAPGVVLPSTWSAPVTQPEIELAIAGDTLYWASNNGGTSALWSATSASFVSPLPGPTAFPAPGGSDVGGLVADTSAVYAAVSTPLPQSGPPSGPSPDSWQWPASPGVDTATSGDIYRIVPGASGSVEKLAAAGAITFFPGFMQHVLAQSSTEVYWVDSTTAGVEVGRVMAASKADWATDGGHKIGAIQSIDGQSVGFVGLAANDAYSAWAVAPQPFPGAQGCWVWASASDGTPKEIFDSDLAQTSFMCNGLAIDAQYAYFAMVEVYVPPAGADSSVLLGTGIARVPLGGGPLQTVSLESDRWYGARRVLVDDTFVYAIDPSYVLRFPKADFGP